MKGDNTSKIIEILDGCSTATSDVVYFPVASIGELVSIALAMRRELSATESRADRLQEQVDSLLAKRDV